MPGERPVHPGCGRWAVLAVSLQIGGAAVLALVTVILSSAHAPVPHGRFLPGFKCAMLTIAGLTLLGVLMTLPHLANKAART